jgi:hypothetical protein
MEMARGPRADPRFAPLPPPRPPPARPAPWAAGAEPQLRSRPRANAQTPSQVQRSRGQWL